MTSIRSALSTRVVLASAVLLAALVAMSPEATAAPSASPDGPPADYELRAVALRAGESIKIPEGTQFVMAVSEGMPITAVDDYGNETRVVVRGDTLVATDDTYAVTAAGRDALLEAGARNVTLSTPSTNATIAGEAVMVPMSTCGTWKTWVAPAGTGKWTSTKTCGVIGISTWAQKTYEWNVANGSACAEARGHSPSVFTIPVTFTAYWKGGGCGTGFHAGYIGVVWGEVADVPAMRFQSMNYAVGASGQWN